MKNKASPCAPAFAPPREPIGQAEAWYLRCLNQWIADRGSPPTMREMARWLNRSHNAVHDAMKRLLDKGWVKVVNPNRRYNGNRFVPTDGE